MRAQFWSFDIIFAMVIFGASLVILTFVWVNISSQYALSYGLGIQTLQAQLQSLQQRLLLTGVPTTWDNIVNASNTTTWTNISIGLGNGKGNRLSLKKIMTLMAMSNYNTTTYQASKALLGIGYDYYIIINGTNETMAMGLPPYNSNPYAIQIARQSGVLNGIPVRIQVIVWTNKTFGVS